MTNEASLIKLDQLAGAAPAEARLPSAQAWLRLGLLLAAFAASIFVLGALDRSTQQVARSEMAARAALATQQKQAQYLANEAATRQRRVIDETYVFLRVIGGLSSIASMGREGCEAVLGRQLETTPRYGNLGISAANGHILCATQRPPAAMRLNAIARENAFVVPNWRFSTGTRAGIVLVSPIVDNGVYLGSVFSVLDPARLLQASPDASSLVLLSSANVIASKPAIAAMKLSPDRGATSMASMGEDGVRRIYAFAPLIEEAAPIVYVAAGIAFQPIPAPRHEQVYTHGIVLILILAFATYLAGIGRDAFLLNFVADLSAAGRRHARDQISVAGRKLRSGISLLPWKLRARRAREAERRNQTKIELRLANEALKQTLERFEQRDREMAILNEFSRHLQSCSHPGEIHGIVAQFAQQLFGGAAGVLYLNGSSSSGAVETQHNWGVLSEQKNAVMPDECWALRLSKTHRVDGPDDSLQCPHVVDAPRRGYTCMPLLNHGETLGMLHVQTPQLESDMFLPSVERAQDFAERAALALANLSLRESLRVQSIRDVLTGLYNRRFLEETMAIEEQRARRSGIPIGVAMIDIDHFKHFNDTFGHDAGDALLRELGSCLRAQVREGDTACRYGGEEFTLILPGATVEVATQRAEALRAHIALLEVAYHGRTLGPVTLSIGVASYPQHGASWREVLTSADHALYRAKRGGRNRVLSA